MIGKSQQNLAFPLTFTYHGCPLMDVPHLPAPAFGGDAQTAIDSAERRSSPLPSPSFSAPYAHRPKNWVIEVENVSRARPSVLA